MNFDRLGPEKWEFPISTPEVQKIGKDHCVKNIGMY